MIAGSKRSQGSFLWSPIIAIGPAHIILAAFPAAAPNCPPFATCIMTSLTFDLYQAYRPMSTMTLVLSS